MRSDENLERSFVRSSAWKKGGSATKKKESIQRFQLSSLQRGKMSFSGHERNHLFHNKGGKSFVDISGLSGLDSSLDGRSFALLDFDRDGRQDIALANINAPVLELYRNQTASDSDESISTGNMIAVKLVGGNTSAQPSQYSNRDGVGARVSITTGSQTLVRELRYGEGLGAQNSQILSFGLGKQETVDSITVKWPSGKSCESKDFAAGELITVFENADQSKNGTGFQRSQYTIAGIANYERRSKNKSNVRYSPAIKGSADHTLYISMATWCQSCRNHLPQLKRIREHFPAEQLALIAVPTDASESAELLTQYVEKYQPAYDLKTDWKLSDRKKFTQIAFARFNSKLMPATIVTDKQGTVIEVFRGVPTISEIAPLLSSDQ